MIIHFIIHEAFEGPGAIQNWVETNKHTCTYTRVYNGDKLPNSSNGFEMLVVMGGPQSPATTMEECAYFDSRAEQQLIRQAVEAGKKVLGVCLGAQLLSNAMGGTTVASPKKEIGLYAVTLTEAGQKDELFDCFPETFACGHWHGDMPGLTDESVVIAQSEGCPRQIIRFAPKVYAFQCHFEFTPDAIEAMITNCSDELELEKGKPFVQTAEQLQANDYSDTNQLLYRFLDGLVK
ncbi:gamma-glutamyl-gamma-aminobutyrate hydrolase family protein [Carboxylicivirga sp. A043]|uniref:glutamine amidotransferase-related protein n=1 Tax=Carboxylicivirga litoralis TaxID=2816963 RepID=UPI0021CB4B57|nr:gamma-glutamyl-gamma-aminobutyrate hydrolase family protein [Carboxylicivirga sp. A043]MCU4158090.1 gamma-glutamyl-gamma-aminobutyrate hydrolase family protein [Carboxylicivirga sp. A043]